MKTKIDIIYRCCEVDTKKEARPKWFSKTNCLTNFLDVFKYSNEARNYDIKIHAVHDGSCGLLHQYLEESDVSIEKIDYRDNAKSLEFCLDLGAGLPQTDIIYFLEDDYLHAEDALDVLVEGFDVVSKVNKSNIISLYMHPDRFTREDDIDRGRTHLFLGKSRYWRTVESTTCTWATTQSTFLNEGVYEAARAFGLRDRELFRALMGHGTILFNPMHGAATHCHLPFLSPFVDWGNV